MKGITITLLSKVVCGTDPFGHPVYRTEEEEVDNVLIAPTVSEDIPTSIQLDAKKITYTLAIPKSDMHEWTNCMVRFFGHTWKACTAPIKGIDELVPGSWNQKVVVERYE